MYMKIDYVPFYVTKDRFEIYVLLSAGCVVDGYEVAERGTVFFRFEDQGKCKRILTQLLSKKLKVYAHDMIEGIRTAQAIFKRR